MTYSIDVNGNDNQPEWGYCEHPGCKEAACPIWTSGSFPDDPDLLLCEAHIGARLLHEMTAREAWTAIGARAEVDAAALRHKIAIALPTILAFGDSQMDAVAEHLEAQITAEHPGAALLAELDAARAFIGAIGGAMLIGGWSDEQSTLLREYEQAAKARTE